MVINKSTLGRGTAKKQSNPVIDAHITNESIIISHPEKIKTGIKEKPANSNYPQNTIIAGKIFVTGSKRKLDTPLSKNLGSDIEISKPISYIQFDEQKYSAEYLIDNAPIFVTAIGLAKRGVEGF